MQKQCQLFMEWRNYFIKCNIINELKIFWRAKEQRMLLMWQIIAIKVCHLSGNRQAFWGILWLGRYRPVMLVAAAAFS
jgi:hypothetical protein